MVSDNNEFLRGKPIDQIFDRLGDDREELHQWLIMDTWHWEPAMFLLAGVIPVEVFAGMGHHKVEGGLLHNDQGERDSRLSEIGHLKRQWRSNPDNPDHATPQTYFDWAAKKGFDVYWLSAAKSVGHFNANKASNDESKPLSTRERDTASKIILGMAMDGYGYDLKANKHSQPREIADILAGQGMPVDDDTIRKYLKEAVDKVLPGKKQPK